jgi:glycosyltransferase involved in cell wall biosynthesis
MKKDGIFISWESHTRSKSLSRALDIRLFEIKVSGNRFKRYLVSVIKTILLIRKHDPATIIIQNPSIVLAFVSILLFSWHRKIVMDAHNAAIYPLEGRYKLLNNFASFLLRKSDLVIVTNDDLHRTVEEMGARSFVLPDPIPSLPVRSGKTELKKSTLPQIIFVCTWASDEPYLEFLEAANLLQKEYMEIKITGRAPESVKIRSLPNNLELTGFVTELHYWNLLEGATVVVDLTTRQNCLVCGAYEAAAVGVPCVLSDSVAARRTFTNGYVFVENKASEIAKGISLALDSQRELRDGISEFRSIHQSYIRQKTVALCVEIGF